MVDFYGFHVGEYTIVPCDPMKKDFGTGFCRSRNACQTAFLKQHLTGIPWMSCPKICWIPTNLLQNPKPRVWFWGLNADFGSCLVLTYWVLNVLIYSFDPFLHMTVSLCLLFLFSFRKVHTFCTTSKQWEWACVVDPLLSVAFGRLNPIWVNEIHPANLILKHIS